MFAGTEGRAAQGRREGGWDRVWDGGIGIGRGGSMCVP